MEVGERKRKLVLPSQSSTLLDEQKTLLVQHNDNRTKNKTLAHTHTQGWWSQLYG